MGLHSNREAVLDKFRDLKEEVFHRFLRVEARIEQHEKLSEARAHEQPALLTFMSQNWKKLARCGLYAALGYLLYTGQITLAEAAKLFGYGIR